MYLNDATTPYSMGLMLICVVNMESKEEISSDWDLSLASPLFSHENYIYLLSHNALFGCFSRMFAK